MSPIVSGQVALLVSPIVSDQVPSLVSLIVSGQLALLVSLKEETPSENVIVVDPTHGASQWDEMPTVSVNLSHR